MCALTIGSVAVVQLKIALAAIYSRYTTSLVDGLDPADTS